jgi:hypothetical protein
MNAGKKVQTGVFPNAPIPRETAQEATRGNSFWAAERAAMNRVDKG